MSILKLHSSAQRLLSFNLILLGSLLVLPPANASNVIVDGGFESPVVGPGGYQSGFQTFSVGQSFGPGSVWTVVGSSGGNVAVYPGSETVGNPPTHLNVEEGNQAMDLTGNTDNGSATGVSQTFATTPGGSYMLSFYEGAYNGQPGSAVVDLNGALLQTATTGAPQAGYTTQWTQFSDAFVATGATTTLSFVNNSLNGTTLVGLDNIQVNAASSTATPEPSSFFLLGGALFIAALGFRRRNA